MSLECGLVVYRRPCRKAPRTFNERDVKRIATYAVDAGIEPLTIAGYVLSGLGLGYVICIAAKSINSTISILRVIREIAVVFATATVVRLAIEWIKGSRLARIPRVNIIVAFVVAILVLIERVISAAEVLVENIDTLDSIVSALNSICSSVAEAGGDSVEFIRDKFD